MGEVWGDLSVGRKTRASMSCTRRPVSCDSVVTQTLTHTVSDPQQSSHS